MMEIVIKIDEKDYQAIKNGHIPFSVLDAIANGTPLPKGHGRLIDVDELIISERPKGIADDVWKESNIYKLLSNASTIIDAEGSESE